MLYSYCVNMCEDFASKFGDKRIGCCMATHTSFFSRESLTRKNVAVSLHPPYFSVSLIEDKIVRPPF
jgi:hypothetical protein